MNQYTGSYGIVVYIRIIAEDILKALVLERLTTKCSKERILGRILPS